MNSTVLNLLFFEPLVRSSVPIDKSYCLDPPDKELNKKRFNFVLCI